MNKIRNVHLIELLYDLIYVFALTRLTTTLSAGALSAGVVFMCLLLSYLLLQSWFLLTCLVHHHRRWLGYEYILLAVYLGLLIYMSFRFTSGGRAALTRVSLVMMIIMGILAFMYLLLSYSMRSRAMLIHVLGPLSLGGCYLLGVLVSLLHGPILPFLIIAAIIGTLIPFVYQQRQALTIRFHQFAQGTELMMMCLLASGVYYVVLFVIDKHIPWAIAVSLTLLLMAGCYILQNDTMIDLKTRHMTVRYIYSHYAMMLALLGYFMSLQCLGRGAVGTMMLKGALLVSLGAFMLAMIMTAPYYMKPYHMTRFVAQRMLAGYAFGLLVVVISPILLFVLLGVLWIPASFFYLLLEIYDEDET